MLMVARGQPAHFETPRAAAKPVPELVFPEGSVPRAVCEQLRQFPAGDIPVFITAELERKLITLALARTPGNISRAAKLPDLSPNGLNRRMGRYGIE